MTQRVLFSFRQLYLGLLAGPVGMFWMMADNYRALGKRGHAISTYALTALLFFAVIIDFVVLRSHHVHYSVPIATAIIVWVGLTYKHEQDKELQRIEASGGPWRTTNACLKTVVIALLTQVAALVLLAWAIILLVQHHV